MTPRKLRIVIVSAFYSEGMGYSENCLSRALARLGHEVHVIASTFNVYANDPLYDVTYRDFLGPRQMPAGTKEIDGYQLHRLPSALFHGYILYHGLNAKVAEIAPDIVHSLEVASLQTWQLALGKLRGRHKLFCETHQTLSVMKPYMLDPSGPWARRAMYRLTRTVPTALASRVMELCYAVTPDCAETAERFYGVPREKLRLLSLGADTDTFHPVDSAEDADARIALREELGYTADDIVCMYTGRFTKAKNPLVFAQAVDSLAEIDPRFKGIFIGNGEQRAAIAGCRNVSIMPFMTHKRLAAQYRAADIGIWPREESMSMIDAAASGVPLIVSNRIGEPGRVAGNGKMYEENSVASLAAALQSFSDPAERAAYGAFGRKKMLEGFSWVNFARTVEKDFFAALATHGVG